MRQITMLLIFAIGFGCSSDDEQLLGNEQFSVKIIGDLFIPDLYGTGSFNNNKLEFVASDTFNNQQIGEISQVEIIIWNPQEGINVVNEFGNNALIRVYQWRDSAKQIRIPANSGEIFLNEADTVTRVFVKLIIHIITVLVLIL